MAQTLESILNSDKPQPRRKTKFGEIEEIEDAVTRAFYSFKHFEVVSSRPSDHHYYDVLDYMKQLPRYTFKKRMEEEWNRLRDRDLIPSSIFVRAYASRVDLMSLAFVCPSGSEYEHSLFFFDICFPTSYPGVPPKIHYRSYGIEWHPELKSDGRVNLDILDTRNDRLKQLFHGSSSRDKWNPNQSNVLDVLYAIQNLISRHRSPSEEHKTKSFALACEMMTRVLRRPPEGFEYLVAGHFRRTAHPILLKFKESNYEDETMIELFIRMFTVFERNGAYCKHHLDFLKSKQQKVTIGGEVYRKIKILLVNT